MPVSRELGAVFIHIPKCAGTSIESALGMHGDVQTVGVTRYTNQESNYEHLFGNGLQHMPAQDVRAYLTDTVYDKLFSFSFVRNPWDRLIAHLAWRNGKWAEAKALDIAEVGQFIDELESKPTMLLKGHLAPQYSFLTDSFGNIDCDFIGSYELLNQDWDLVCDILKIKAALPKRMASNRQHYTTYYTDDEAERVAKIYEKDIKIFDYEYGR
ncbi:sulfotransferase family 2 domain-containing protein [uncultured Umboniibacter sp.]|uniref:sulfotransferase family 2 domain-containing protein n=1 Tax=uncultured Umboniibacter sp. TaxID=1798917 RepID=UPI00262A67C0|nr:sulfotransferase family 2 domain-containing protein [uncultured Umboniibacter sp.]